MASTSLRMMRLLTLLQTHRYWPGIELADRLDVSLRTVRRDVDRLRELGYPVQAQRGVDGGYQLAAGAALPPLVLDDEEAVALALGLRAAAQASVDGLAEASVSALAKVAQVMPPRLRRRVEALGAMTVTPALPPTPGGGPSVDPGLLTTVAQACRDTERLRFAYTAAGGERTERETEPTRLVSLRRRWYLVAYDLGRHDWRSFRLDRLERPETTGVRFRPRQLPAPDAAAFVRAGMEQLPVTYVVEVVVDAPVDEVRRRIGAWASVEPIGDGRCRARMTSDALVWPAMALAGLDTDFTVLGPPEMVTYLQDLADRFARAAGGRAADTGPPTPR